MQADKDSERTRLLQQRQELAPALARQWADAIAAHLQEHLTRLSAQRVAVYMPFRGEPDLTRHYTDYAEKMGLSLPLCDENGQLQFISWQPGQDLTPGRFGIPVPQVGVAVCPDVIVLPCVGFNRAAYRLGYGGGWFDRTLACWSKPVHLVGVAYGFQQTEAFTPQAHDTPLHAVVTERGVLHPMGDAGPA